MQAYLSSDNIFLETKFQPGAGRWGQRGAVPPAHNKLHPWVTLWEI